MDSTQILISVTLVVTTIFLIIIGVQVVRVLQELRDMLKRANNIVEGFERMGTGIETGFNEVAGFVGGLKSVFKVLEIFQKRRREGSQDQPST